MSATPHPHHGSPGKFVIWMIRLLDWHRVPYVVFLMALGAALGLLMLRMSEGATTTIPERAQTLCGKPDCTAFIKRIKGSRRRLTIVGQDGVPHFGTLTNRNFTDAMTGHACANCTMPTEAQLADALFMVNALIWQTPDPAFDGELKDACPFGAEPVIYRVYPSSIVIVDHSLDAKPTIFQIDVRVGCL